MKRTNITIGYDEEKLTAIRLFLSEKNLDLEKEVNGILDSLFKKYVPAPVRNFIEQKATGISEKSIRNK